MVSLVTCVGFFDDINCQRTGKTERRKMVDKDSPKGSLTFGEKQKEVVMKFLLSVLAVRFIVELFSQKDKNAAAINSGVMNKNIRHPAEFMLR